MTIRSTSGMSVSVCQTVAGALPEILVSAAIMSRSRLRPGRRTTADFTSPHLDRVVLDHRVRQQLVAHRLEVGFRLGTVGAVELDVENLALADRTDACEVEGGKRALDGLSLRIEHAVLQRHRDTRLDQFIRLQSWPVRAGQCGRPFKPSFEATSTGPVGRGGSFSFMMPRRRATSW